MLKNYFKNNLIIFASLLIFACLFYSDAFKHFFYQDDIWHFYISSATSFKEFLEFFNPINKFAYQTYRPLSTQVVFFGFQNMFGLNHTIFQLLSILFLSINSFLIYGILRKYTKGGFAFLLSIFYIIHHQNIGIIYYLSTIQISIALFFTLLSIREIQEKRKRWQIKVLFFYLLAIFSQEISLLNPIIFIILLFLENKKNLKIQKKLIISLLSITMVYMLFRFYFLNQQIFENTHYQISLNPKTILNNLFWYCLWMMSIPEYMINFVGSGLKPLPPLFGQYKVESILSLIILLINTLVTAILLIKSKKNKKTWLYLCCFVFALAPILIFPWHKYVYYLPIASVFILIFFSQAIAKPKKIGFYYFLITLFIVSALVTNFIDRKTSYNYKRGVLAKNFQENIDWSSLANGEKTVFIANDPTFVVFSENWGSTSSQAKIIFKDNLFFTVLSKNEKIQVIYEDDLENLDGLHYDYKIVAKKEW